MRQGLGHLRQGLGDAEAAGEEALVVRLQAVLHGLPVLPEAGHALENGGDGLLHPLHRLPARAVDAAQTRLPTAFQLAKSVADEAAEGIVAHGAVRAVEQAELAFRRQEAVRADEAQEIDVDGERAEADLAVADVEAGIKGFARAQRDGLGTE